MESASGEPGELDEGLERQVVVIDRSAGMMAVAKRHLLAVACAGVFSVTGCTTIGEQMEAEENERKKHIDVDIEDCGLAGVFGATGVITNDGDETYTVYFEIGYFDGDTQVENRNFSTKVQPGRRARWEVFESDPDYDDCEIVDLSVRDL